MQVADTIFFSSLTPGRMLTLSVSLFIGILGKMGGSHCGLKNTNDAESSLKGCPVTANGKS